MEKALALMGCSFVWIPQNAAAFSVGGACFTRPTQMIWAQQLASVSGQLMLHMDGKYKLHHSVRILLTLGTHMLKGIGETGIISRLTTTTFVPLVYLFCKNHESTGE